jgi:hypothetical protein
MHLYEWIFVFIMFLLIGGGTMVGLWWLLTRVPAWVQSRVDRLLGRNPEPLTSGQRRIWVPIDAYLQSDDPVPTARMGYLYREHLNFHGAPTAMALARQATDPGLPRPLFVARWPEDTTGVSHFTTLGMSNLMQPGTFDSIELHFACKIDSDDPDHEMIPSLLHTVADDPFENRQALKAGHIMRFEGIPGFPSCVCLMFLPSHLSNGTDHIVDSQGPIHFLDMIPLTESEATLAATNGAAALFEHLKREKVDVNIDRPNAS